MFGMIFRDFGARVTSTGGSSSAKLKFSSSMLELSSSTLKSTSSIGSIIFLVALSILLLSKISTFLSVASDENVVIV